jgi:hypothetical protein
MCIWRCLLDPGRRNDKRSFDESDAPETFLVTTHEGGVRFKQERLAVIMDRGYQGVQKYWPKAIIRFRGSDPEHVEYNLCVDRDWESSSVSSGFSRSPSISSETRDVGSRRIGWRT